MIFALHLHTPDYYEIYSLSIGFRQTDVVTTFFSLQLPLKAQDVFDYASLESFDGILLGLYDGDRSQLGQPISSCPFLCSFWYPASCPSSQPASWSLLFSPLSENRLLMAPSLVNAKVLFQGHLLIYCDLARMSNGTMLGKHALVYPKAQHLVHL